MRARSWVDRVVGAVLVVTIAGLGGACGTEPPADPGPEILIEPGLVPRLGLEQVEQVVLNGIRGSEAIAGGTLGPPRIVRVTVTTDDRVALFEPRAGRGGNPRAQPEMVWIVRATSRRLIAEPSGAGSNSRSSPGPASRWSRIAFGTEI